MCRSQNIHPPSQEYITFSTTICYVRLPESTHPSKNIPPFLQLLSICYNQNVINLMVDLGKMVTILDFIRNALYMVISREMNRICILMRNELDTNAFEIRYNYTLYHRAGNFSIGGFDQNARHFETFYLS